MQDSYFYEVEKEEVSPHIIEPNQLAEVVDLLLNELNLKLIKKEGFNHGEPRTVWFELEPK